jgi:hypothetical protein
MITKMHIFTDEKGEVAVTWANEGTTTYKKLIELGFKYKTTVEGINLRGANAVKVINERFMNEDFDYKGYDVFYIPHPKLYGNFEVWFNSESFIGRTLSVIEAKAMINRHIKDNTHE